MMLLMYIVACIACAQGITIEVITDLAGQDLECNSTAIISCKFPPVNTSSIRWKISTDVMNFSTVAARCEPPLSCTVNPAYNAQYSFTFDEVAGVSNVTIKRVTFEHNGIQFRCDDNFAPDFIQLNVTEPPDADTTQQENKTIGNHTILTVKTECVYPTDNISIEWYSRKTENSLLVEHRMANKTIELCDISADCIFSNKSARVESALNISEINLSNLKSSTQKSTTSYQNRVFQAVIRYGFKSIEIDFGDFPVQEISTPSSISVTTPSTPSANNISTERNPQNHSYVNIIGAVGGSLGFFIIVIVFAVWLCRRRKTQNSSTKHRRKRKTTDENKF